MEIPLKLLMPTFSKIKALPVIHGTSRPKINEFYDQLLGRVPALGRLGRLKEVAGNVRMTLDKLILI